MRSRRTPLALAGLSALAPALILGPPAAATEDPAADLTIAAVTRLYAPRANPAAYRQAVELVGDRRMREAVGILAMVRTRTPHAVWLAGRTPHEVKRVTRKIVKDAGSGRALPVLVPYNIPGRDCGQYSKGGVADTVAYRDWIGAVAKGIGRKRALVVLEPDALALVPADCKRGDAEGVLTAARYEQLRGAVATLGELPRTRVYLDAGHPAWHSVNSIVPRLVKGGIKDATGFSVNVSNYSTDSANAWYGKLISSCLAYVDGGGKASACPDQWWPRADAQRWLDRHVSGVGPDRMKHFVTDSSRNGRGPWTPPAGKYSDAQDWCNPPARGLGARPTTRTGDPLHDARLWIKVPGESDGQCTRGTSGPKDPVRGTVDPKAGTWFPEQALELVRHANPALMRGW